MNNRYLFRAKLKESKNNNNFVHGYYLQNKAIDGSELTDLIFDSDKLSNDEWYLSEINPDTLCQCTGLKDKNGTLIFEGDIILIHDKKYPVIFESPIATFGLKSINYPHVLPLHSVWMMEVIGNVFDNSELLL